MTTYMDIEEFMDLLEGVPRARDMNQKPSYELLMHSISGLDKTSMNDKPLPSDLTADLFSTMTDSEMISHFIPMRGIDYDQSYCSDDDLKKAKSDDQNEGNILISDDFLPDRVMPQLSNPAFQVNSAFKPVFPPISRMKELGQSLEVVQEKTKAEPVDSPNLASSLLDEVNIEDDCLSPNYTNNQQRSDSPKPEDDLLMSDSSEGTPVNQKQRPSNNPLKRKEPADAERSANSDIRPIKKRKPRTYKYNPKPLQHKQIGRSFVPDDLKDIEYWQRRKRNNEAAKKSREERRKKELEIMNSYEIMKQEYSQIKVENIRLKARNVVLENQIEDLLSKTKC